MTGRIGVMVLGVLALAGCENMGLEYAGTGDDAQYAPPSDLASMVSQTVEVWGGQHLIVDGRRWVPSDISQALSEDELRAVGSAGGVTVYARSWDSAPYDFLYTRLPEDAPTGPRVFGPVEGAGWLSYLPVIGGGAPRGERTGEL